MLPGLGQGPPPCDSHTRGAPHGTHGVLLPGQGLWPPVRMLFAPSRRLARSSLMAWEHRQVGALSWYSNDTAGLSLNCDRHTLAKVLEKHSPPQSGKARK